MAVDIWAGMRRGPANWQPATTGRATAEELYNASREFVIYVENSNSRLRMRELAYDNINAFISENAGVQLPNPLRRPLGTSQTVGVMDLAQLDGPGEALLRDSGYHDEWALEVNRIFNDNPELGMMWGGGIPNVENEMARQAQDMEQRLGVLMSTREGLGGFAPVLGGGMVATFEDPAQLLANLAGLTIGAPGINAARVAATAARATTAASRSTAANILRTTAIEAANNAAFEAAIQPFIQENRAQFGLEHGWEDALQNVLMAGAFGGVFGGAVASTIGGVGALRRAFSASRPTNTSAVRGALDELETDAATRVSRPAGTSPAEPDNVLPATTAAAARPTAESTAAATDRIARNTQQQPDFIFSRGADEAGVGGAGSEAFYLTSPTGQGYRLSPGGEWQSIDPVTARQRDTDARIAERVAEREREAQNDNRRSGVRQAAQEAVPTRGDERVQTAPTVAPGQQQAPTTARGRVRPVPQTEEQLRRLPRTRRDDERIWSWLNRNRQGHLIDKTEALLASGDTVFTIAQKMAPLFAKAGLNPATSQQVVRAIARKVGAPPSRRGDEFADWAAGVVLDRAQRRRVIEDAFKEAKGGRRPEYQPVTAQDLYDRENIQVTFGAEEEWADPASLEQSGPITNIRRNGEHPDRLATRQPWARGGGTSGIVGLEAMLEDASYAGKVAGALPDLGSFKRVDGESAEETLDRFADFVSGNLLWLHDAIPSGIRDRARLWYDGARLLTEAWSARYQLPDTAVAGALAALSPQKDWFMNVSLAERVLDVMTENLTEEWSPRMTETADRILPRDKYAELRASIDGRRGEELDDPVMLAAWVRIYSEANHDPSYRTLLPEGTFADWAKKKNGDRAGIAWSGLGEVSRAIMAIRNPADVSFAMGRNHKVRNFYNNILAPRSKRGDVTIDTHAIAAGLLLPVAGTSPQARFGMLGPPASAATGMKGAYGVFAEGYRRAAAARGVLPREMQSITWEAVRTLFTQVDKRGKMPEAVDAVWKEYRDGRIGIEVARERIAAAAGGIGEPGWVGTRPSVGRDAAHGYASYARRLPADGVPAPAGGAAPRVGVRTARRSATLERRGVALAQRGDLNFGGGAAGRGDVAAGGGERGRGYEGGGLAPLEGSPARPGASGPDPSLVSVADRYAASRGINLQRQAEYVDVDPKRARRIAEAYEAMPHAPNDPAVREAYQNLIDQTKAQYRALVADGYVFTFFDEATDPYGGNPWNAVRDLRQNKRMAVYGTYDGFGPGGLSREAIADNPMLQDTGEVWLDQAGVEHPVTANDMFRAVHDAFGHGLEGAGFRARGEENAWQAHVRLFEGTAIGALTTETRGQNSWLNYGPHGETNRTAGVEDTVFAEQKTGLMPEWTWTEGLAGDSELAPERTTTVIQGPFDPNDPRILNQDAWHGSPFTFDEFSLDWLGSGEGNQAFGWGLYFAGKREIAEFYRDMNDGKQVSIDGKPFALGAVKGVNMSPQERAVSVFIAVDGKIDDAINRIADVADAARAKTLTRFQQSMGWDEPTANKVLSLLRDWKKRNAIKTERGRVYEVSIPDDDVLLYYDGTWDQQPPKVRRALRKLGITPPEAPPLSMIDDVEVRGIVQEVLEADPGPENVGLIVDNDAALYQRASAVAARTDIQGGETPGDLIARLADGYLKKVAANRFFTGRVMYQRLADKQIAATNRVVGARASLGHKDASLALNEAGIPGLRYRDGFEEGFNYVIFDDKAVEMKQRLLEQRRAGAAIENNPSARLKGRITLEDNRSIIEIFKARDQSTFMHESAHQWLEEMIRDGSMAGAPPQMVDDLNVVLKWFGVETPGQIKRQHHEKWARAFERYLAEGKAPSKGLQKVFDQFKVWMTRIYGMIRYLAPGINAEVRGVMDRMLVGVRPMSKMELEGQRHVFTDVQSKLKDVGYTDAEATMNAAMWAARYSARAQRLNEARGLVGEAEVVPSRIRAEDIDAFIKSGAKTPDEWRGMPKATADTYPAVNRVLDAAQQRPVAFEPSIENEIAQVEEMLAANEHLFGEELPDGQTLSRALQDADRTEALSRAVQACNLR